MNVNGFDGGFRGEPRMDFGLMVVEQNRFVGCIGRNKFCVNFFFLFYSHFRSHRAFDVYIRLKVKLRDFGTSGMLLCRHCKLCNL